MIDVALNQEIAALSSPSSPITEQQQMIADSVVPVSESAFAPISDSEARPYLQWSLRWTTSSHSQFSLCAPMSAHSLQVASALVSQSMAPVAANTVTASSPLTSNSLSDEQVETRAFELMAHLIQQQGQTRALVEQMISTVTTTSSRDHSDDCASSINSSTNVDLATLILPSSTPSESLSSSIESHLSSPLVGAFGSSRSTEPIRLVLDALTQAEQARNLHAVCHSALTMAMMFIYWRPCFALAARILNRLESECQWLLATRSTCLPSASLSFVDACRLRAKSIHQQLFRHQQAGFTLPFIVGESVHLDIGMF
jgi:hypothetical protein